MTPATSTTCGDASPVRGASGPSPDLLDFGSIPSDAMTPRPPLCAGAQRAHRESLESKITPAIRGESTKMQQCDKSVIACAQSTRHHVRSMNDKGCEHGPDILAHDQVGDFVEFGRLAIDDDKTRAITLCHQGEAGRRPDQERGADRQE